MTSKFVRFLLALACVISVAALAQTGSAASSPAASSAASSSAPVPAATGTKVGTVNIEQAIYATNDGRRDFEALCKKL